MKELVSNIDDFESKHVIHLIYMHIYNILFQNNMQMRSY